MDPLVLIDAIAICMAYEEKELCKIGEVALAVIFDVASIILGSKERVRNLEDVGQFNDLIKTLGLMLIVPNCFTVQINCACSLR